MGNSEQKVSRRTALPIIAVLPIAIVAACSENTNNTGWKPYTSRVFPYRIDYPSSFTELTITQGVTADFFYGEAVNGIRTHIKVDAAPLGIPLDRQVADFAATYQLQDNGRDSISILESPNNPNTKRPFRVAGNDAYQIKIHIPKGIDQKLGGVAYDTIATLFIARNLNWTILLTAESSVTQQYLHVYKHMLDSFHLTG